jgi:GNAT superfamily N-acetyltransferase
MVQDARVEDAAAIARVHTRSWQVGYAHAFPEEALRAISVERRAEFWSRWLATLAPRAAIVVADLNGDVAGFASVGAAREGDVGTGELYAIYVDPDRWGTGIGRALIAEAEERLRAASFGEAILWVLDDNPRARRFYEAAGWAHDGGTKQDTHLDTLVDEVRYRKRLA